MGRGFVASPRPALPRPEDPVVNRMSVPSHDAPSVGSGLQSLLHPLPDALGSGQVVEEAHVVDVAQLPEPVQRWFTRHRVRSEGAPAGPRLPEGMRIRRRKDNQLSACSRLLGLVSTENGYPLPRPSSRRGWLTGEDVLDAWIVEQHGMIQGHVAITRADSGRAAAFRWREVTGRPASELAGVSRFFVRSSVRGQGLGTALLETAVEEARARGLMPVAEMVSTSRQGIPLYDRAGWRMAAMYPCGQRRDGLETYLYVAPGAPARS